MNLIESLTLVYNFLMLVTLGVLAWQAVIQRRHAGLTTLEGTYARYLEFDRLAIEYPSLQQFSVRAEAYETIKKLDDESLRKRAYIELIMDCHELMFVRQQRGYYQHQHDYLKSLLSNPHVREYWETMRGNFRGDFVEEINKLLAEAQQRVPK